MVYKRHYWKDYDETKTETQNIEAGAVVTTEKLNEIENGIVANYSELDIKKSDKTYVDSMLSSIAQGGPRGLFYSLAALKTKYPSGADGTYLVFDSATTNGAHSYIWDKSIGVWKDLGIYQGVEVPDKSVTAVKTTFVLPKLINLFDRANILDGSYYVADSSDPTKLSTTTNTAFAGYIFNVSDLNKYYIELTSYYCYYLSSEGKIIGRFGNHSTNLSDVIAEPPTGCTKIAVSFRKASINLDSYVISEGTEKPAEFRDEDTFVGLVKPEKILKSIPEKGINTELIDDKAVTPLQTDFLEPATNMLDLSKVTKGGFYVVSNGVLNMSTNANYWCALIPVKELTDYYFDQLNYYAYFLDVDKKQLLRFGASSGAQKNITATSPTGSAFVAFSAVLSGTNGLAPELYVMNEGNTKDENASRLPVLKEVLVPKANVIVDSTDAEELSIDTADKNANGDSVDERRNWYKYPLTPVWGHEYLHPWYLKVFENQNIRVAVDGDSTTSEDGDFWKAKRGRRVDIIAKMFKIAQYDTSKLIINNNGYGSRATGEWVGSGEYYSNESDLTDFPNGILDRTMKQNPDLLIFGYGLNDASRNADNGDSIETRINRYVANVREGLTRIRSSANSTVNGRPCYGRGHDDLAIILCTPVMSANSPYRFRGNWIKFLREELRKLAREFYCGFCDLSARHYDHEYSKMWSSYNVPPYYENHDGLHPTPYTNADMISLLQDLILPVGLWKYDTSDVDIRFRESL